MRTIMLAATALTPFAASLAAAADLDARSRIDAVTVYPDAALVTRVVEIDLPAGASNVLLKGLPYALDPASLRVSGEGTAAIGIGAVEARLAPADTKPDTAIEARLKSLRADREGWQTTLDALTAKSEMIRRFAQSSPEKLGDDKPLDIGQWNSAFDTVGAALARVGDDLRAARARARDLDEEIKAVEASRPRQQTKQPMRDIAIALDASGATKAKLSVSYRVSGASWRPAYDARLDTGGGSRKPTLELVRRAQIFQRTGEDWGDVSLAVSTTRALRGAQAPDVQPERIAFWEPPVPMAAGAARPAPMAKSVQMDAARSAQEAIAPAAPPPVVATEQQSVLQADAWQANFVVPGRISVPADGATKNFALGARRYEPALIVKASPALDPTAYLSAHLENAEDAPLLPGSVSVQRDGVFVGQGALGAVAPGEGFDLGFGADDRVTVARVPVKRKENEPTWYNQTKIDQRDTKTVVKNLHDFPIKTVIVDRIPFSENTAITVEQLPQTTPPTEKQVGDKRGVMSWTFDLKPGEQKEIRVAWRMKWPADRDVVFQPAPNPK